MAEGGRIRPLIQPLGDAALVVRFGERLDDEANRKALALAQRLEAADLPGIAEIVPNLVSVFVGYDPAATTLRALSGEIALLVEQAGAQPARPADHAIAVRFGGEAGPDLDTVAAALGMGPDRFLAAHNGHGLRVLAIGFAPGFAYCGFHGPELHLPRRTSVRPMVPAGSVLFAAGQTAIAATPIPTGWNVIGRTDFRGFDPADEARPVRLKPGDSVHFRESKR
jgi:KipI family sensor histidine kinase inhibitor